MSKKRFFFRSFPNVFTHPPTPGFLWDLGKRKVKFGSKKAIFGGDLRGFWRVWTLFGNQPPHPPTFGKDLLKKTEFFMAASLIKFVQLFNQVEEHETKLILFLFLTKAKFSWKMKILRLRICQRGCRNCEIIVRWSDIKVKKSFCSKMSS